MNYSSIVGIDVSKDKLDCSLVNPLNSKRIWYKSFSNDAEGISQLLSQIDPSVPMVAEPTGPYTLPLAKQSALSHTLYLAPTKQAKSFCKSIQSRAKTDNIDSYGLALFGASRQLSKYPIKSDAVEELDNLLSYRKVLSGNIVRMQLQAKSLPRAAERIKADIAEIRKLLASLDKDIERLLKETKDFAVAKRLQKVPGFGPVITAALTARLTSKDFVSADQFVAYIGLDVSVIQSGKRSGTMGITKQGDAEIRRLLYCAVMATLRIKDCPFKNQYDRERAKGHSHVQAVCTVSRKMARLAWSLVKYNADYAPDRVYKRPE